MNNRLNVCMSRLGYIERKIVNIKLNLLDENITFGKNLFDLEYLKCLNNFLFCDLYFEDSLGTREILDDELKKIDKCLTIITKECLTTRNLKVILENIEYLWHLQIFGIGNTRTLYAYLKIINSAFLLGLNIDPNIEISNNPKIFRLNNFVNQNRLTKTK